MWTVALVFLVFFQQPDDEATISSEGPQERNGSVFSTSINVEVIYQDIKVNADWIRYDESTNILEAGEAVHFERAGEKLDGKHLAINLTTKAGVLKEARGNIGPGFYVTAAEVQAEDTLRTDDATITNCEGPRMVDVQYREERHDPVECCVTSISF
jgi:lipopolysaccharide assembly outer membrane protein LptD (OstA)